jgi:uncharacterized protein with HEPN domain
MTADRARELLRDAIKAAEQAQHFLVGRSLHEYLADALVRSAVERQLEIVGEALAVLRRMAPGIAASIDELPKAVALRNILIHGYSVVDDDLIWDVATYKLPPLLAQLRQAFTSLGLA